MANVILKEEASSGQSKLTHVLNLNTSQWALFSRLLDVGSALADDLIEIYTKSGIFTRPSTADLWNQLCAECMGFLDDQKIYCSVSDETR